MRLCSKDEHISKRYDRLWTSNSVAALNHKQAFGLTRCINCESYLLLDSSFTLYDYTASSYWIAVRVVRVDPSNKSRIFN